MSEGHRAVQAEPLGYAVVPPPTPASNPAATLMFGGLGLILLGGGFLGLVLVLTNITKGNSFVGRPPGTSGSQAVLYAVLYLCALTCFGGATWLIRLAVRSILGRGQ